MIEFGALDIAHRASKPLGADTLVGWQHNRFVHTHPVRPTLPLAVRNNYVAIGLQRFRLGDNCFRFRGRDWDDRGSFGRDVSVRGARTSSWVVCCVDFFFTSETIKSPVAVASPIVAHPTAVAVNRAWQSHLLCTVRTNITQVTVALTKQTLPFTVAASRATLHHNTRQRCGAIDASVAGFACTRVTQTNTMLGTAMSSLAAFFRSSFDDVNFKSGSGFGDTFTFITSFAAPARDTMTGTVDTDTIVLTVSSTLHRLFTGGSSITRGAETLAAKAVTAGWFDHLTIDWDIRRLARVLARRIDLHCTIGTAKSVKTETFAKMAHTMLCTVVGAIRSFKGNHTAVFSFVARLTGTDTTDTNTMVVTRAHGTRTGLGFGAVRAFKPRETFAFALDTHALGSVTLTTTAILAKSTRGARFTEAFVKFTHTLAITVVLFTETTFYRAVRSFITIQAKTATVTAQAVVGTITRTGMVNHHSFTLTTIKTSVAHTFP